VNVTVPDIATVLIGESATDTTVTHVLHASANANVGTFSAIAAGDLPGGAGQILAGATPALTATPALGTDNSAAGTLTLANGAAAAHTIIGSAATTTNTILGFATVPTTGHLVDCTVSSTTCTFHDSGVVTANVVNASSPGAGVAHFAGSTQTVTSSLIVTADITGANITGAKLNTANQTRRCEIVWGGTGTANALSSGDDAIANQSCYHSTAETWTITAVACRSDVGSNTTTVNPTYGSIGAGTTILSGAMTCGSSGAYQTNTGASLTISNASLAQGANIDPVMSGTLTGTSIHLVIEYTVP